MISPKNKTGHFGVRVNPSGNYEAYIHNEGKTLYLGTYKSIRAAAQTAERACQALGRVPFQRGKRTYCKYGHVLSDDNRIRDRCKKCHREYKKIQIAREKEKYWTNAEFRAWKKQKNKEYQDRKKAERM